MSTKLHTKSYSNNDKLFFLLNPNEDIAENDPVRVVDAMVENLDLRDFKKLYRERGRCAYHPKMMLKIIRKHPKQAGLFRMLTYHSDAAPSQIGCFHSD